MEARTLRMPLRIVFYREGDAWIAHCLEFDLIGDGDTKADAIRLLTEAIATQFAASLTHENLMNLFTPADGRFLRMFAAGKDVAKGVIELQALESLQTSPVIINDVEVREYMGSEADCGTSMALV